MDGSGAGFEPSQRVVEVGMKLEVEGNLNGAVPLAREAEFLDLRVPAGKKRYPIEPHRVTPRVGPPQESHQP